MSLSGEGKTREEQLACVRNAARDMARAYIAFERGAKRLGMLTADLGGATPEVVRAVQEGVNFRGGADAFEAIHARLAVGR